MKQRVKNTTVALYGDITEAAARYGIGKAKMREVGAAAGAVVKIGRLARYNYAKIDAYLETLGGAE